MGGELYNQYKVSVSAICYESGGLMFVISLSQYEDLFRWDWILNIADEFCEDSPITVPYDSVQGGPVYYNCWTGYTGDAELSW